MGMEFNGEFIAESPRESVFGVLSDPDEFAPLLPTYQSHETQQDGSTQIKVKVAVGKIRGTATISMRPDRTEAPSSASYNSKGKVMGAAFNFGSGFELEDADGRTLVKWRGDLDMFGKLMSLAGGMIRPIADKQIKVLIDAIQAALSSDSEVEA